ncbi:hypothetical protein AR685_16845 [Chryseobacterium sp. JAH]|nr:hypothetical protein AR685_16845 [Chryseobacterium sp. JAH]
MVNVACWYFIIWWGLVFRTLENGNFTFARCVFVPTNFGKFLAPKTILPFLQKGEKTAELVFLF